MERVIARVANHERDRVFEYAQTTPDGNLLDVDIFAHDSTFTLEALRSNPGLRGWNSERLGYLPVQQPLMLENLLFRPGLDDRERALTISRLVEQAMVEAYRRDAGELYFLCRHPETCEFALRHSFRRIDGEEGLGLKVFRLNLLETFGV